MLIAELEEVSAPQNWGQNHCRGVRTHFFLSLREVSLLQIAKIRLHTVNLCVDSAERKMHSQWIRCPQLQRNTKTRCLSDTRAYEAPTTAIMADDAKPSIT